MLGTAVERAQILERKAYRNKRQAHYAPLLGSKSQDSKMNAFLSKHAKDWAEPSKCLWPASLYTSC